MSGRTLVLALVLVVLVAVPQAAVAKGVEDAQVCGADGCFAATLDADNYIVFDPMEPPVAAAPASPGPYYELRYKVMRHEGRKLGELLAMERRFYPRVLLLRDDGQWLRPDRRAAEALADDLAQVEPLGKPAPARAQREEAGGLGVAPIIALVVLACGAALALGSRRRRRPAAG
jgi:hypothetical protein